MTKIETAYNRISEVYEDSTSTEDKKIKIVICGVCNFHIRLENSKYGWISNPVILDDGYMCDLNKSTTELTPCRPLYVNRYESKQTRIRNKNG
tara:strand:- start:707 stop:985 length:279 start_codon:yes stop_codon:yes gene_type:complete